MSTFDLLYAYKVTARLQERIVEILGRLSQMRHSEPIIPKTSVGLNNSLLQPCSGVHYSSSGTNDIGTISKSPISLLEESLLYNAQNLINSANLPAPNKKIDSQLGLERLNSYNQLSEPCSFSQKEERVNLNLNDGGRTKKDPYSVGGSVVSRSIIRQKKYADGNLLVQCGVEDPNERRKRLARERQRRRRLRLRQLGFFGSSCSSLRPLGSPHTEPSVVKSEAKTDDDGLCPDSNLNLPQSIMKAEGFDHAIFPS